LGGLAVEEFIDHEREEGYEQGYDNGYDNGFDNDYDDGGF
jgi:flagellar biosynthesis/type III secretory pathway protein FliH